MNQDLEHLRLLSIFHYVVAGLTALFACIPILHLVMGLFFLFAPDLMLQNKANCSGVSKNQPENQQPENIGTETNAASHSPAVPQTIPADPKSTSPTKEHFESWHRNDASRDNTMDRQMARVMGGVIVGVATAFILIGWTLACCVFLAGRYLRQQRHYTFCLVIAAICCMMAPFGTVLGIFTIVVLMQPSVKELFAPPIASQAI